MVDLRAPKHLILNAFPLQDSHRGRGVGRVTMEVYTRILRRWERQDPQLTNAFSEITVLGAQNPDLREIFDHEFQQANIATISSTVERRNLLKYFYYRFSMKKLNEYIKSSATPTVYYLPRHQILTSPAADYTITMVHDFAPLRMHRWGKNRLFDPLLRLEYTRYMNELKKADFIITNSDDTTNSVAQYLGRKSDVQTVHLGNIFEDTNTDHYERRPSPLQEPYFVYYSGYDYNKNIPGVIKAFALFIRKHEDTNHTKLVFSGGKKVAPMLIELARNEGILENIILMDHLTDEELAWYAVHSLGLFRLSFVEGCGLPEIEFMAMGVPVISADIGAVQEMLGGFGLLANPRLPETAEPLLYMAAKKRVDLERLLKGKAHARSFTWEKTAEGTINAIISYTQTHKPTEHRV
jgi:glycosyltransferase involved in cell wall biosynthesis